MTAANQHIVTCFETLGMSPEQIAEAEQLELVAVKAILYQCSGAYRESIKAGAANLDFSDVELQEANAVIAQLMRYSEDDGLRYRAAKYLRDDKKGRRDRLSGLKSLNINITQINAHLGQVAKQMTLARQNKSAHNGSTDRTALGSIREKDVVEV